jgi:concentrative nucleoside transporter, CNT family
VVTVVDVLWGIGGMVVLLAIAVAVSSNRRAIRVRTVAGALALQVGFGVAVLFWSPGERALEAASRGVQAVINSSREGIGFLFGPLLPDSDEGVVFALQVLPVIIFFASLTAVLYHLGVLQWVVKGLGGGLGRLLGTQHAESVNAAANIFVGQTEAPLVIRPYIGGLSRSGLFAVMVGGLSTVAGSVLVGYSLLGAPLEYLIAASFMAAPGALLMAKIILPEDDEQAVAAERERVEASAARRRRSADDSGADSATDPDVGSEDAGHRNVIDAAASGAADGLRLAATIGAMLLAFISLIALANLILGGVGGWFGNGDLTLERILGWVFAPLMTVIGVPWDEAVQAGSFVGQKTVINEFVAFTNFGPEVDSLSDKTAAIVTFALTGFANLGSLGILLGGLGGIAPERRPDIAALGLRAILAATLANLMSAAIAGILLG